MARRRATAASARLYACTTDSLGVGGVRQMYLDTQYLDHSPADAQHALMSRRSTQQQKTDDAAFPVRILVIVPETGFGHVLGDMSDWLSQNVGRGRYAQHSAGRRIVGDRIVDAVAFLFVSPRAAADFAEAFPVELADGTTSKTYSSPGVTPVANR